MSTQQELTRRERQVLLLLSDGGTSAQIAHGLGLSPETIDKHLSHIRLKLNVRNRTELVALALREGLVPSADGTRPACIEVTWGNDGRVEEFMFRYVPAEGNRRIPMTSRTYLDAPISPWLGPDWQESASALLGAIGRARDSDDPQPYDGVASRILDDGGEHRWSGEIHRVSDTHFLMVSDNFPSAGAGGSPGGQGRATE